MTRLVAPSAEDGRVGQKAHSASVYPVNLTTSSVF
jgi:hypothetical protein